MEVVRGREPWATSNHLSIRNYAFHELRLSGHSHEVPSPSWTPGHPTRRAGLYRQPIVNSTWVQHELDVAKATANKVLTKLEDAGIVRETTGFKRNRLFRYDEYVDVFDSLTDLSPDTTQD